MSAREITYVTIGEHDVPAFECICPVCKVLDLDSEFVKEESETGKLVFAARCTQGHEWIIAIPLPS